MGIHIRAMPTSTRGGELHGAPPLPSECTQPWRCTSSLPVFHAPPACLSCMHLQPACHACTSSLPVIHARFFLTARALADPRFITAIVCFLPSPQGSACPPTHTHPVHCRPICLFCCFYPLLSPPVLPSSLPPSHQCLQCGGVCVGRGPGPGLGPARSGARVPPPPQHTALRSAQEVTRLQPPHHGVLEGRKEGRGG